MSLSEMNLENEAEILNEESIYIAKIKQKPKTKIIFSKRKIIFLLCFILIFFLIGITISKLQKKIIISNIIKNNEINATTSKNKKEKKRNETEIKMDDKVNLYKNSKYNNAMIDNIEKSENNFIYIKRNSNQKNKKKEDVLFLRYIKKIEAKNSEFEKHNITIKILQKAIDEIEAKEKYELTKSQLKSNTLKKNYTAYDIMRYIVKTKKNPLTLKNMKSFDMVENPKISIIIPIKESYQFLKIIHKSIQDQSFKDIEIIYIDDGSKDKSVEFLKKMQEKDKRIIILKNKGSKGPFYNRNKGAIFARGEYLQFVDSDDMLAGNILEKAYIKAKNENIDIIAYLILKQFYNKKYYIFRENTNPNIIHQPDLSEEMFYGKNYLKRTSNYIFNKIIKREKFLKALIWIGDEVLKENLYMQEDLLQFFALLRVSDSLLYINQFGYGKIQYEDNHSLMSNIQSGEKANKIYYDNFIELKLICQKTKNEVHDKGVCYNYFTNIRLYYQAIANYITKGYELFDEVFDLLLKSPFFSDERKKEFSDFQKRMYVNRKSKK